MERSRKHDSPKRQDTLFDLPDPTVVPRDEFERRQEERSATPASVALQAGIEADRRLRELEPDVEPRADEDSRYDIYVEQGTMSRQQANALKEGRSEGYLAFRDTKEWLRQHNRERQPTPPPEEWR